MRLGSVVMMAAALVFGLAAAFLAKIWLENQTPEPRVAKPRPAVAVRTIVVAAHPLRFGMEVSAGALKEIEWPKGAIPKGAFARMSDILDGKGKRLVLSAIAANEPVLKEKITGPGQRATLSALVGEGRKAVAISVNDVLGVAGFVLPGERVDILLTQTETREVPGGTPKKLAYTDVLLQNVRVLAIDQLADDRTAKPAPARTVTVEVDALQAQKIALASSVGTMSLALRSAGETGIDRTRRISLTDLRGEPAKDKASRLTGNEGIVQISVTRAGEKHNYAVPRDLLRAR